MLKTKIRKNLAKLILSATMVTTVAGGTVTALAAGATSSDYVNFRTGPGMDHSVQFVVKPGTTVNIVSEMGYWSKVEVSGKTGYMATEYLVKDTAVETPDVAVTTAGLNLRASGSLSASVLTVIPSGTAIEVIGSTSGSWINVKYGSRTGWVSSSFITIGGTAVVAPKPTPQPPAQETATGTAGEKYELKSSAKIYMSASDAAKGVNSVGTYSPGSFYIFRTYSGMLNISRKDGSAGAWINPDGSSPATDTNTTPTPKPSTTTTTTPKPTPSTTTDPVTTPAPSADSDNPYPGYTKMVFDMSFYSNLPQDNGGYTVTASGTPLRYGVLASNVWPRGTVIVLPGWGTFTVEDRGGSDFNVKTRLDMLIEPNPGESQSAYLNRIMILGRQKITGYVKP